MVLLDTVRLYVIAASEQPSADMQTAEFFYFQFKQKAVTDGANLNCITSFTTEDVCDTRDVVRVCFTVLKWKNLQLKLLC